MYLEIYLITIINFINCDAIKIYEILRRRHGSPSSQNNFILTRRLSPNLDLNDQNDIIGVPSRPYHLPEAEPILPGHTLLRPSFGMLKSALKYPHVELDGGAGVYGNYDNLGIRWDSRNERLLYTGFRRMPSDYIMIAPSKPSEEEKQKFLVSSLVLDEDKTDEFDNRIQKKIEDLWQSYQKKPRVTPYVVNINEEDRFNVGVKQRDVFGPEKGRAIIVIGKTGNRVAKPEKKKLYSNFYEDKKSKYLKNSNTKLQNSLNSLLEHLIKEASSQRRGAKIVENKHMDSSEANQLFLNSDKKEKQYNTADKHWIMATQNDFVDFSGE